MANMDASVRGGTDRIRYYVAGSSLMQDGVVRPWATAAERPHQPGLRAARPAHARHQRGADAQHLRPGALGQHHLQPLANALANPPVQPVYTEDGGWFETLYANPVGMNNEAEAAGTRHPHPRQRVRTPTTSWRA
jgi:TonB-dependent starch-binding outer membrane protein SusC